MLNAHLGKPAIRASLGGVDGRAPAGTGVAGANITTQPENAVQPRRDMDAGRIRFENFRDVSRHLEIADETIKNPVGNLAARQILYAQDRRRFFRMIAGPQKMSQQRNDAPKYARPAFDCMVFAAQFFGPNKPVTLYP